MGKPFEELFQSRTDLAKAVQAFDGAIRKSFETHPVRHMTSGEIKRRFQICERWFRTLRGDKKWSVPRVLDTLPAILRAELDGATFTPDERSTWTAT